MRKLLVSNAVREKGIRKDLISGAIKVFSECAKRIKTVLDDEKERIIDIHVPVRDEYLVL